MCLVKTEKMNQMLKSLDPGLNSGPGPARRRDSVYGLSVILNLIQDLGFEFLDLGFKGPPCACLPVGRGGALYSKAIKMC